MLSTKYTYALEENLLTYRKALRSESHLSYSEISNAREGKATNIVYVPIIAGKYDRVVVLIV